MCCFHALKVSYLCLSLVLNIILILSTATKFLLYNQNICLNGFKFVKTYYFFCSKGNKFSTFEESFHSQGIFPQSKNFSIVEEFFHNWRILPQSWNFSIVKEFFHGRENFWQKNSADKEVFHEKFSLIYEVFHKQRFLHSQKIFCKQRSKRFSKSLNFRPSHLILVGKRMSCVLKRTISFLSTCELLLLNIKKLIICNVSIECTSMQTN